MKIKVDFEGTQELLQFITDTQEGKYTEQKPDLSQITYKRLQIQEQDVNGTASQAPEEVILFGIS